MGLFVALIAKYREYYARKQLFIRYHLISSMLLHPDQAACIKGRNIQKNNNNCIRDFVCLAKISNDIAIKLSINQIKAYEKVSHVCVFFQNSKFPENVINIV